MTIETDDGQSGNLDTLTKELQEAVTANAAADAAKAKEQAPQADAPQVVKLEGDQVPPKLKGKTLEEVVDIYRNLESQYGRMANDLGQQRVLTDRLLNLKRDSDLTNNGAPAAPEVPKLKAADVLEDPTAAIDKVVEARLKSRDQQAQVEQANLAAQAAAQRFISNHPDYQSFVNDQGFTDWVNGSPTRKRAAALAAGGNWELADDLLVEYKDSRKAAASIVTDDVTNKNLEAARKAGLETSAAASAAKTGKQYKRADLLRLQMERPDVYYNDDFQREIIRAYAEKRVK